VAVLTVFDVPVEVDAAWLITGVFSSLQLAHNMPMMLC
jgi:hypothetical protein